MKEKIYYNPEERALMENIVNGGWLQNQARGAGKSLTSRQIGIRL